METDFYKKWACQKFIEASHSQVWDGHWACAALALTNLLEEKLVPDSMEALLIQHLDKTVEEHANVQPYRVDKACRIADPLIGLLSENRHSCHALGHDVIYVFYLIHLLSRSNIPASAELLDSMNKLIRDFLASGPGFVKVNGQDTVIDPSEVLSEHKEFQVNAEGVLDLFHTFIRPLRMEKGDMQLGHILTHGHALVELKQMPGSAVHDTLDASFNQRLHVLAYANKLEEDIGMGPDDARSGIVLNPMEASYWEQAWRDSRHGHFYKYAYSYLKLHRMAGRTASDFQLFNRIL